MLCNAGEVSKLSGSLCRTAAMMAMAESPVKARLPLNISYNTAPNEKISERASASLASACSGDMYGAVPSMVPAWVMLRAAVSSAACSPLPASRLNSASPKSSSLMPDAVTKMLAGFRSR